MLLSQNAYKIKISFVLYVITNNLRKQRFSTKALRAFYGIFLQTDLEINIVISCYMYKHSLNHLKKNQPGFKDKLPRPL